VAVDWKLAAVLTVVTGAAVAAPGVVVTVVAGVVVAGGEVVAACMRRDGMSAAHAAKSESEINTFIIAD
jgi:hypothetical protein